MFYLQDFKDHAKKTLDTDTWCFHSTGAMNEQTLKDNIEAYSRYIIHKFEINIAFILL